MGIGRHIKSVANPDMQVKLPKRRLRNNIFKSTTKLKDLKQFPALPKMFIRSERVDQQADGHFWMPDQALNDEGQAIWCKAAAA